jgi:hypothetical protein
MLMFANHLAELVGAYAKVSGDAWVRVTTFGISTMAECWASFVRSYPASQDCEAESKRDRLHSRLETSKCERAAGARRDTDYEELMALPPNGLIEATPTKSGCSVVPCLDASLPFK